MLDGLRGESSIAVLLDEELGQTMEYIVRVQSSLDDNGHAPPGKLIDHGEHAELPPIVCSFSKKIENHAHSVALHFMHYNFCRQRKSLDGISPAMAGGVTDRLWDIEDIVRLVDEAAPKPGPRGRYKKRATNA